MKEKERLREEVRARLAMLSDEEIARTAARIESSVWSLPEVLSARSLLLYASIPPEVGTDSIAAEARLRGIQVVYPRCLPAEPMMTLHEVEDTGRLQAGGRFGIREPAPDCPLIAIADIDVAFLPGVAWDRMGNRLGRGGGYYDRLLSDPDWRALRCGLFHSAQEVYELPVERWDQKLNAVITEAEIVRFGA